MRGWGTLFSVIITIPSYGASCGHPAEHHDGASPTVLRCTSDGLFFIGWFVALRLRALLGTSRSIMPTSLACLSHDATVLHTMQQLRCSLARGLSVTRSTCLRQCRSLIADYRHCPRSWPLAASDAVPIETRHLSIARTMGTFLCRVTRSMTSCLRCAGVALCDDVPCDWAAARLPTDHGLQRGCSPRLRLPSCYRSGGAHCC
jgi:hypothetical protein